MHTATWYRPEMQFRRAAAYILPVVMPLIIAAILLLTCSGCGGAARAADRANRSIATTLEAVNAAHEGFVEWDKLHQDEVLAASGSQEEYDAQIAGYRLERGKVTAAFVAAYSAIAAAAGLVPLAGAGKATIADLLAALEGVATATVDVKRAIDELRGRP